MTSRPALRQILMVCLMAIAVAWLFITVRQSIGPEFDLRSLVAGMLLSGMIAVLATACVTRFRVLRIIGAVMGVLLALREYLMLAMANISLREVIREPYGWIGPALLTLFLLASGVALIGRAQGAE
jgi:multisubunit Na+/H+ antiporter MnhE subunit